VGWAYEVFGRFFGWGGFRRSVLLGVTGTGIRLMANSLWSTDRWLQVVFLATRSVIRIMLWFANCSKRIKVHIVSPYAFVMALQILISPDILMQISSHLPTFIDPLV
jgi:hypothetical protein